MVSIFLNVHECSSSCFFQTPLGLNDIVEASFPKRVSPHTCAWQTDRSIENQMCQNMWIPVGTPWERTTQPGTQIRKTTASPPHSQPFCFPFALFFGFLVLLLPVTVFSPLQLPPPVLCSHLGVCVWRRCFSASFITPSAPGDPEPSLN